MGLKIKQYKTTWYYSNGIFTEHTQAIYKPQPRQLVIINTKYLPEIINHLKKTLDITEISLVWYKDKNNKG